MKYLLDSNTCIEHFRRGAASPATNRILASPTTDIALCSIVRAELMTGARKTNDPIAAAKRIERFASVFLSLPFDDVAADRYADVRSRLERIGTPIGPNDMLIAAIALQHGLTVVTNNVREFRRVPGLSVEDWSQP